VIPLFSIAGASTALAALWATGIGPEGPSAETTSPLRIDCPLLDKENQAALEARARAELALWPQPAGEIAIACQPHAAHVGWHAASGGSAARDIGLGADPGAAVDSLLGAVHALRAAAATWPPPPASPRVASHTGAATTASNNINTVTPTLRPPSPPVVMDAAPAEQAPSRFRLGVAAGIHGEIWEGAVAGAIEGQVGLRLDTRQRWALALTGGFGRGVEPASGIGARTMRAMLGVAHIPVRNLEIEAGVEWRVLVATRSIGGAIEQQRGSTLGVFASVRYLLARGRFAMAVGPHLGLLAGPMAVDLDGTEIFRVPRFITGLSVAGRADLNP
jgi:hypothetical protein